MRRAATVIFYAPVAQLDRALDSDSKGRTFESCRAYQIKSRTNPIGSSGFCFMGKLRLRFLERSQKKGIAMRALTEKGDRDAGDHRKRGLRCGRSGLAQSSSKAPV